jgi:hypothetical protein
MTLFFEPSTKHITTSRSKRMESKNTIACLGWGSLIWNPKKLKIKEPSCPQKEGLWCTDGVSLPIEFLRISDNGMGRVTLVIDREEQAVPVTTLWVYMDCDNLQLAMKSLWEREGGLLTNIHYYSIGESPKSAVHLKVKEWMEDKAINHTIWTGLSWRKMTDGAPRPTIEQIIAHLKSLESDTKRFGEAKEYIQKAPPQIDTAYRSTIMQEFGWKIER